MSFKATKSLEAQWYTPEDQEGEPAPLRFRVRPLRASEKTDILAQVTRAGRANTATFRDCFAIGASNVENCEKPNGKPLNSAQAFMQLGDDKAFDYVIEVGAHIFDISFDDDEEKKT